MGRVPRDSVHTDKRLNAIEEKANSDLLTRADDGYSHPVYERAPTV